MDSWVIIDTETDGLFSPIHTLEIAAQVMDGWEPVGKPFQIYLNHDVQIPADAFAVHGYSQDFLREHGVSPREAHEQFREYARDLPLVAHNLSYDWNRVLEPEWNTLGIPRVGSPGFCLLKLARRIICETSGHSLDTLRSKFQVPGEDRHHALGDVLALVDLFTRVYRPRLERARVNTFKSWALFSTATPIEHCLARALSAEEISNASRSRLANREAIPNSKDLERAMRRIFKKAPQVDTEDSLLLWSLLQRFDHLRQTQPGLFVFKWMRDCSLEGEIRLEMQEAFLEMLGKALAKPNETYYESNAFESRERQIPEFDQPTSVLFPDRWFCFTGTFKYGSRPKCEAAVIERGGICSKRPRFETDYVVVGQKPTEKLYEGAKLRAAGAQVKIIDEATWAKYLIQTPNP